MAQHISEQERNVVGSALKRPVYQGQPVNPLNDVRTYISNEGGTIHLNPEGVEFSLPLDPDAIKWYTDTIIKPLVQQAAQESADKAIRQFMEANPPIAEVQPRTRAKTGNKWVINRDSEGAIASIYTMKDTPQKEPQSTNPAISLRLPDKTNIDREHISYDA